MIKLMLNKNMDTDKRLFCEEDDQVTKTVFFVRKTPWLPLFQSRSLTLRL